MLQLVNNKVFFLFLDNVSCICAVSPFSLLAAFLKQGDEGGGGGGGLDPMLLTGVFPCCHAKV